MSETSKVVGDFVLGRQIGSGSFAVVWKGENKVSGEEVAVKEINTDKLNKKLKQSLESEVSILKRIDHKNIVKLHAAIEETNRMYLVMEYCAGGDLAGYIRRCKRVPEVTARELMQQLSAGLKELWSHHLVHRDLKPQNLLLSNSSPQAILKIADFGFARNLQPQGLAETLCGSPLYMAPEILQFHKYDAKADLWSVGTILYELLIGRPPFNGANHVQLLRNIERNEAKIPEGIAAQLSEPCKQLILQLLKRNPVERISFEEFFAHPFLCPGSKDATEPQDATVNKPDATATSLSDKNVTVTGAWISQHQPSAQHPFPFIVDNSLPRNTLVALDTRPKVLEGRQCSYAEMPLKPELKTGGEQQSPRPFAEGKQTAKNVAESKEAQLADSIEDDYVLIDSLPSTSNSTKNSQNQASGNVGSQSSSHSNQRRLDTPPVLDPPLHLLDELTGPEEETPDTSVFPLQSTEEEFVWEVARTLDYLAFCKHETGLLPDALCLHLLSLDVLYFLLTHLQSTGQGSGPSSSGSAGQNDHLQAQLKQAAHKIALTAEQTAHQLQQSGYCYPLPDVVDTVYQNALTLGRGGAVEELLGNYSTALQAYSKAGTLLHFLGTHMPSLEQTFKVSVNKEHRMLLTKYTLHVSARYSACKTLEAQDPIAALSES